jgi:ribokinase
VGQVGSDWGADFMLSNLESNGVQTEDTIRKLDEQTTGTALVLLFPSGENSIIIAGGANTSSWEVSESQKDAILNAKTVLLQREIPDHVNLQVAQICKKAGVNVILDAGGAEGPLGEDLLSCLSLLSPNESELARMTEMEIKSSEDVLMACKKLQQQGANDILVKLGSRGSVLVTSKHASNSCMPLNM